jgi:hypothetical protein
MIQIDSFLASYQKLKDYAKTADFGDIVNPVDGVIYPGICDVIPDDIRQELLERIEFLIHRKPHNITMFMRRSPAGVHCPHIVHNDLSMGTHSLMLYMNDNDMGGTALVRHFESGMMYNPEAQEFIDIAIRDQNSPDKWASYHQFAMKENSVALFDAGLFHCAMPIGGFGDGTEARTVLTVFFS